jgi:hypothetical protein
VHLEEFFSHYYITCNFGIILSQVASLLHDDVLDDADTRRGIGSLNFVMGNKVCVYSFGFSPACHFPDDHKFSLLITCIL